MKIDKKRLADVIKSFDSSYHQTGIIPGTNEIDNLSDSKEVMKIIHTLYLALVRTERPAHSLLVSFAIGFMIGSSYAEVGQLNASLSDKS